MTRMISIQTTGTEHRLFRPILLMIVIACSTLLDAAEPDSANFDKTVKPFLNTFCIKCHGKQQQKGDRRFDQLTGTITNDNALVDLQDVLDLLNLSEMPPKSAKQPTDQQRRTVIRWLTQRIKAYHQQRSPAATQTVLRRLNAREYRNTVRDLLHLDMTMFDPTVNFPKDQTTEHLDNVGETLVTSGFLLAKYLEAAEQVVDKALFPLQKPPVKTWVFEDNFRQQPEIDQVHKRTTKFKHMTLYDVIGADNHEGAYGPILAFKEGVPFDGDYEIRLNAIALNRKHQYDPKFLGLDPDEPFRLGIRPGNQVVGKLHTPQPIEPLLTEFEIADELRWCTVRVRLDKGYTPRFTFPNGLMDSRSLWTQLVRKYPKFFPPRQRGGIVETRYNAIAFGKLPQINIHEIEIKGPLYDQWPRKSQRVLLGENCEQILKTEKLSKEESRRLLMLFAQRAWRRKIADGEVERLMSVVDTRRASGRTPIEAFADGAKAVLCSPNFLYLDESTDKSNDAEKQLSATALATRLSYFLWSSMPDEQLRWLAASGQLRKPAVIKAQVERMLQDKKSDAFIDGFLGSWLNFRDLGSTPPDRSKFRAFYHYNLDDAMRQETKLFMRHMLDEDLDIANFLDSDFTFVNKPLARMYGIEAPKGYQFEKVSLTNRRRGGLLGQASILTLTANGIDTSPVVRGVWVLENILGTPPSPPPPDVEPIDPDIRGAKTIRDQLKKHRSVASCNDCHRKIDPLGFALENYDPIGRWRGFYSRKAKVDASGELPNGKSFKDIEGLKRILVGHQSQFAKALTEKLLAYAIGRKLTISDRPEVDSILSATNDGRDGFRSLIRHAVQSELFRSE